MKKKSFKQKYEEGDPTIDMLGKSSGKFDYYVNHKSPSLSRPTPNLPKPRAHNTARSLDCDIPRGVADPSILSFN